MRTEVVIDLARVWQLAELPCRSIALDGAVAGPLLDPVRQRYSFDHHAGCLRLVTSATCQQVLDAILMGLEPVGHRVFLNDLDADTVLSTWLIEHAARWLQPECRRKVTPLVANVGAADAHGPGFIPDNPSLVASFHRRVLAPVRKARLQGYPEGPIHALETAVSLLEDWWQAGLAPAADAQEPAHCPFELQPRERWVLATLRAPPSTHTRGGFRSLYRLGFDRVVVWSPMASGRYRYTLARRSDLVAGFPLERMLARLEAAELEARGTNERPRQPWGGGSSIGGSPGDGSVLAPARVAALIDEVLNDRSAT